tara:strand:- start:86 stop:898 length:813 start_codon:yes stop_codon:yes gene_type:complete
MLNKLKNIEAKKSYLSFLKNNDEFEARLKLAQYLHNNDLERMEDIRSTDWHYLIDTSSVERLLIVGFGFGKNFEVLKRQEIDLLDSNHLNRELAKKLKDADNAINYGLIFSNYDEIDLIETYDLILLSEFPLDGDNFQYHILKLREILKKDGKLVINVANRINIKRQPKSLLLSGYKKRLSQVGFKDLEIFARLPDYNTVPLYYLPLENNTLRYFYNSIIKQVESISPEARRKHYFKYRLIIAFQKLLTTKLGLALTKHIFPAYTFIMKK